jgi:chemotaxis protein CheZ
MTAIETAQRVRSALASLNRADLKDPRLVEVLNLSEELADAMQHFFSAIDRSVQTEFRYIATYIARTRQEISALRPNEIRDSRLPSAGAELEAIVRNTENATHTIMSAAEQIMAADPNDAAYPDLVNDRVMEIFQACSFQDITGQRVQKIVDTLRHIESRVARFAHVMGVQDEACEETEAEKRRRELLLNGPSLNGPEVCQDAIDALFADAAGPASQDSIDKLFA